MMTTNPLENRAVLDSIIHRSIQIYRWAVIIAFAFIATGFFVELVRDERVPTEMGNPAKILQQLVDLHASGFFGVGIGVMILAPIVMIASAATAFYRAGDTRYGLISTAVADILSFSIVLSFAIG